MKLRAASLYLLTICIFVLPALAQNDLYNNGPTNGNVDAWTINFGFLVADSFNLTSNSTVNGLNFAAWLTPGDVLESVDVWISSEGVGGTTYFNQQVNFTQSGCSPNQYNFDVCNEVGHFSGPTLNAGTYWVNLYNAVVNNGDPVYWDENDGPSSATETYGDVSIPSESFTILGSANGGGTTPEPDSVLLFASGVLAVGSVLRRKLF
jgi:hypothetical protein